MGRKQTAGKDRRGKKGGRTRSKELNTLGDQKQGSDMDAFTDTSKQEPTKEMANSVPKESPEVSVAATSSPTEGATAASSKEVTPEPVAVETVKESSPAPEIPSVVDYTPPTPPQEKPATDTTPSDYEQRRVAERNEKNSKEHSTTECSMEENASEPSTNSVAPDSNENHIDSNQSDVELTNIDKTEPVIKKDKIELKYKYREDQWSPLNPEGKMHYDRSFLLQLQYSSDSLEKPEGLPPLPDVVLETPMMGRNEKQFGQTQNSSNSKGMLDFTPAYVMPSFSGKPPVHQGQRRSQQRGGDRRGGSSSGPQKVINIQLQHEVKLHQTENAWAADHKKTSKPKDKDDLEETLKKVRSILNKLTPQKFQVLLQQIKDLGIDTEAKLAGLIDVTFEKAISEPSFSVAYANLCKCMTTLKVASANNPNEDVVFRKLLLNRCQREFERDMADMLDIEKMQKAIDEAEGTVEKKKLTAEKEMAEYKARKRSLGNIRFIGELFKLKMLTENIMHDCLLKLLRSQDEDSLEALCRLLSTIGKDIDHDRAKDRVDQYFVQLRRIIDSKKHSSRVRFMLRDVIDLRKSGWVPRRDDNAPKTIEQIHKEALEEEQKKKIMLQTITIEPKRKGGRGSQSGGQHGNQQGEDGWTPVKTSRPQAIDPARMKITKQSMDESIQLGPGGRPGSFGAWGRGSSGGSKQQAPKDSDRPSGPTNRYSLLRDGGSSSQSDSYDSGSGRSGYSRGGMTPGGSKGGRLSQGRNDRDRGDRDRSDRDRGDRDRDRGDRDRADRGKHSGRASQEQERESALAAARMNVSRNIGVPPRSGSGSRTPIGSRNQSRESSRNRDPPSRDRSRDKRPPSASRKELSFSEVEKKSKSLVDEYLSVHDKKEALLCIKELESSLPMCVNFILTHVLERSAKARQMASQLLHEAMKERVIHPDQYTKGLQELLEYADDMAIDIPQIWKYLGELIGPMVEDGVWPMSNLRTACKPLQQFNKAGLLVTYVLEDASHRLGHLKVGDLWRYNRMEWSDFLDPRDNLEEFISKHKLEYTVADEAPKSPEATTLPMDRIQRELEKLIDQADNEVVFDWINANVADSRTREPMFIRALMTAVCNSSISGAGTNCKVDVERLKKRCILLQRFLDHKAVLELQALYALQALVHRLEHPIEVLRVFFDTLYDEDIISEDAFYQWESSKDAAEQAGKGVAVNSVVQFFTWLREAEEEDTTGQ